MNFKKAAMFGLDARIALAIYGALSVVSGSALVGAVKSSKLEQWNQYFDSVEKASSAYYADKGTPLPLEDSVYGYVKAGDLVENYSASRYWKGPYLNYNNSSKGLFKDKMTNKVSADALTAIYLRKGSVWSSMDDLSSDELCDNGSSDCAEWISIYANTDNSNLDLYKLFKSLDDKYDYGDGELSGSYRYNSYDTGLIMKKGLPRFYNDSAVGVACYGSSIPNSSSQPCTSPWQVGEWGSCDGSGTKYRSVSCPANHTCEGSQPSTSSSCEASWQVGSWSACSGGSRTRSVTCPSGYVCSSSKPATSEVCSASWQVGSWGSCSGGTQYRSVTCPSGYTCSGSKPSSSQGCVMYASWQVGSWYLAGCATGYQTGVGHVQRYRYLRDVTCPSGYTCSGTQPSRSKYEGTGCGQ